MTRRETLALVLLILLGLATPAVLLTRGLLRGAAREERLARIPYEGTARELYTEHAELLNDAAEILWAHPEFFERYRLEYENDAPFPLYELRLDEAVEHPFTEGEWQMLRQLAEQRWLGGIWYYWGKVPVITCSVSTEEPGMMTLTCIRSEGFTPSAVQRELDYQMQLKEWYEQIEETDWYVGCFTYPW